MIRSPRAQWAVVMLLPLVLLGLFGCGRSQSHDEAAADEPAFRIADYKAALAAHRSIFVEFGAPW